MFVVLISLVLLGIATPRFLNLSGRVAVGEARAHVTSAVSMARAAAVRFGRVSYLVIDAAGDRLLVQVDTSALGGGLLAPLDAVDLWDEMAVNLTSNRPMMCFDPRGLAVAVAPCTGQGLVVRLARGDAVDSVVVSATGRVVP